MATTVAPSTAAGLRPTRVREVTELRRVSSTTRTHAAGFTPGGSAMSAASATLEACGALEVCPCETGTLLRGRRSGVALRRSAASGLARTGTSLWGSSGSAPRRVSAARQPRKRRPGAEPVSARTMRTPATCMPNVRPKDRSIHSSATTSSRRTTSDAATASLPGPTTRQSNGTKNATASMLKARTSCVGLAFWMRGADAPRAGSAGRGLPHTVQTERPV